MPSHLSGRCLSTLFTVLAVSEHDPSAAYLVVTKFLVFENKNLIQVYEREKMVLLWIYLLVVRSLMSRFIPALDKAMASDVAGANSGNILI